MLLAEVMFLLVSQFNWKNILLLNANEEGSTCLLHKLNSVGKPIISVGYKDMQSYPWHERWSLKPPIHGYLMMTNEGVNLTDILRFLQEKHLLAPRRRWIIGVEGPLCLTDLMPSFDEGDRVVIIGDNISLSNGICQEEKQKYDTSMDDIYEEISMWTLRSLGNGSTHFERINFMNLSSADQLFDSPFRNFRGRTLRITSLGSPPIRIPPRNGEKLWHGYIFRIINTLADFFNFTYTVKEAADRLYGMAQEDGSWTGLIGELAKKSVDIGTGDLSWTLERSLVVDLTKPVFPETVTFIYRAPEFYSRTWILFQGIETKVWIGMISSTVAAFAIYFLALSVHRLRVQYIKDPTAVCIESADESISSLYRALLGKGVVNVPFQISCRAVLGTWFIGSLILNVLYGGSLTSKLSLHKSPKPADSLKELLRRHPNAVLALRNSSQIHEIFKKSQFWHKVWLKNMQNYVIPGQFQIHDTMIRVHNSSDGNAPYVWVAERSMLVKLMQNYSDDPAICDLYVAKENIVRSDWSLALQRSSPFFSQFNELIIRMEQFGLLEKWRREYWESATGSCHPNDGLNQSGETPITMDDTRAIFIVLAIGWAVGLAILIAETRFYKWSATG